MCILTYYLQFGSSEGIFEDTTQSTIFGPKFNNCLILCSRSQKHTPNHSNHLYTAFKCLISTKMRHFLRRLTPRNCPVSSFAHQITKNWTKSSKPFIRRHLSVQFLKKLDTFWTLSKVRRCDEQFPGHNAGRGAIGPKGDEELTIFSGNTQPNCFVLKFCYDRK